MITVLCGGFGAARFLDGLRTLPEELCCVVNTADDLDHLGLVVMPDTDSVLYALAGVFDEERGFGQAGDTFAANAALARSGADWFRLGDADLAHNLQRTALIRSGRSPSEAVAELARGLGIRARVLPMTDGVVRTRLHTDAGTFSFQDFVVRRQARPAVRAVEYEGVADARPAPGVLDALESADLVVLAPSNPVSSLGPILALDGVRRCLEARTGPTVAVTPVVAGRPPARPPEVTRARIRAGLMAASGLPHRPLAVAVRYQGLIDGFVLDRRDPGEQADIEALGLSVLVADTLAAGPDRVALARAVVDFGTALRRPAGVSQPR
jgi:LPPG:FO 2-phospho-L-lactate transferase